MSSLFTATYQARDMLWQAAPTFLRDFSALSLYHVMAISKTWDAFQLQAQALLSTLEKFFESPKTLHPKALNPNPRDPKPVSPEALNPANLKHFSPLVVRVAYSSVCRIIPKRNKEQSLVSIHDKKEPGVMNVIVFVTHSHKMDQSL